jgi:hypothetical protein
MVIECAGWKDTIEMVTDIASNRVWLLENIIQESRGDQILLLFFAPPTLVVEWRLI